MVKGSFFFPFRSAEARNQRRAGKKGDSLAYHVRFSKKEGEKRLKKGRRRKENWEKWKPRAFEKKAAENSCTQNGREMRRKRERRNRATESESEWGTSEKGLSLTTMQACMHFFILRKLSRRNQSPRATRTTTFEAIHAFVSLSAPSSSSASEKK